MTLEEFIDLCELSLGIMVKDYGTPDFYRLPTEADFRRKIMRVVSAAPFTIYIVLRKTE